MHKAVDKIKSLDFPHKPSSAYSPPTIFQNIFAGSWYDRHLWTIIYMCPRLSVGLGLERVQIPALLSWLAGEWEW